MLFFIADKLMPIFCNTQTTVERQYFSAIKKLIWNSAQTWVTEIFKNDGLACRHPSAYCTKLGSECYRPVYWEIWGVVWILRTTWCSQKAAWHKEQYKEFALINHRWNSNLGFQILHAEN